MLGRGVWGPGRRVRLYRAASWPGAGRGGQQGAKRAGSTYPFDRVCAKPGKGARTQDPRLLAAPPASVPSPRRVAAHCPGSQTVWGKGLVWKNSAATGGLSLCGVQVWKSCRSGVGALIPLSTSLEGMAEETSGVINSIPLKVGGEN